MKLLVTGLTGLVGSRINELLNSVYELEDISLSSGTDILDKKAVLEKISNSKANLVLHLAAKTNVDGCEIDKSIDEKILSLENQKEREDAWILEKTAWAINTYGIQNVVDACKKTNKKIIYMSTDFVFNGQKKIYTEEDKPDPINWYAKTKYEAEKIVQKSGLDFIIIRPAYPYRALFKRNDFVRAIIEKLRNKNKLNLVTDHIMVPAFIDDIANALDVLINTEQSGIFHVVGSQAITPYDAALQIAEFFDLESSLISKTTRREYFMGKAQRPFCLNLKNDKISKLGVEMSTFDKGLREIKAQLEIIK